MHQNLIDQRGGNIAFSRSAMRQGQSANNGNGVANYNAFQTLNNVQFSIDGLFGTLAPTDNLRFSAGHPTVTGCNELFYAVWVNNTNAITTTAGPIVDPATLAGVGAISQKTLEFPAAMSNNVLIGLIKVKVGTGATFTPNVTNFNATNITTTFIDTAIMPTIKQLL